jgi:hypothetical protein
MSKTKLVFLLILLCTFVYGVFWAGNNFWHEYSTAPVSTKVEYTIINKLMEDHWTGKYQNQIHTTYSFLIRDKQGIDSLRDVERMTYYKFDIGSHVIFSEDDSAGGIYFLLCLMFIAFIWGVLDILFNEL